MSILSKPYFHDEMAAYSYLESVLWPNGPVCPHCQSAEKIYALTGVKGNKSKQHPEGRERYGLKKCASCRKQFTVTVGTIYESSHIPLHKWLQATYLMASSKKGISAHQLHRVLEITYKSAWFMSHRIREAMADSITEPIGGSGKIVEVDETYVGGKEKNKHRNKRTNYGRGAVGKAPVVSLVERGGTVRSKHLPEVTGKTLRPILEQHINKETCLMTDDAAIYPWVVQGFSGHETVNHSKGEYVRDNIWHTNTVENYFSLLKRGIIGTFHHVSQQHLGRYVAEFDFRYNNRDTSDLDRAVVALAGAKGRRLMYKEHKNEQENRNSNNC